MHRTWWIVKLVTKRVWRRDFEFVGVSPRKVSHSGAGFGKNKTHVGWRNIPSRKGEVGWQSRFLTGL